MTVTRIHRQAVVLVATAAVLALVASHSGQPWRAMAVVAFVACVPGLALKPLITLGDRTTTTILVIAVSLGLACLVSQSLAIAHVWSALRVLVVLGGLSVVVVLLPDRGRP